MVCMRSYILYFLIFLNLSILNCRISYFFQTIALPKPDKHLHTGTFMGYEIFLWNCLNEKRIVVYRWETEMSFVDFDPYHKEESFCNEMTEFEKRNGNLHSKELLKR